MSVACCHTLFVGFCHFGELSGYEQDHRCLQNADLDFTVTSFEAIRYVVSSFLNLKKFVHKFVETFNGENFQVALLDKLISKIH